MNRGHFFSLLPFWFVLAGAVDVDAAQGDRPLPELQEVANRHEARIKAEVDEPFAKAVASLNANYISALERQQSAAQKLGKLEEALLLRSEQENVAAGKSVRSADAEDTPETLKAILQTYWSAHQKLESERNNRFRVAARPYGEALEALKIRLTQQGRLDDAKLVAAKKSSLETPESADPRTGAPDAAKVAGAPSNYVRNPPKMAAMTKLTFEHALQTGGGITH